MASTKNSSEKTEVGSKGSKLIARHHDDFLTVANHDVPRRLGLLANIWAARKQRCRYPASRRQKMMGKIFKTWIKHYKPAFEKNFGRPMLPAEESAIKNSV